MDSDLHIIHKVSVEVSARTSMDTNVLQEKIKALVYDAILKKIETYFQGKEAEIGSDTVRIDRLELNLSIDALDGIFTNLDLHQQVDEQLSKFFRSLPKPQESLRSKKVRPTAKKESIFAQRTGNADMERSARTMEEMRVEIQKMSPKARKIETLVYFLKNGTTPWWIKDSLEMHSILHEEVLLELLDTDADFSTELKNILKEPHVLLRLTSQFAPLTVAQSLIFLQHGKWPELARFQGIFSSFLTEISNLPRSQRFGFWQTFVRALRVHRFASWKEKVLLELRVLFTSNAPSPNVEQLFNTQGREQKQMFTAEIAFLLMAMTEFNTVQFPSIQEYVRSVAPTISKEALTHYILPETSKAKGKSKASKKDDSAQNSEPDVSTLSQNSSASNAQNSDLSKTASDDSTSNDPVKSSGKDLEARFDDLRKQHDLKNEKLIRKLTNNMQDEDLESPEALSSAWKDEEYTSSNSEEKIDPEKGFIANHAGLLLLHPFMKAFCERWELLNEDKSLKDADKMAHILHFMATGQEQNSEFELTFEKYICGLNEDHVVDRNHVISDEMKEGIEELLKAVLSYWDALKSSSTGLLRNEFLKRPARIIAQDNEIHLTFERKSIDLLIDKIPWTIGFLKLPWRKEMIHIEW